MGPSTLVKMRTLPKTGDRVGLSVSGTRETCHNHLVFVSKLWLIWIPQITDTTRGFMVVDNTLYGKNTWIPDPDLTSLKGTPAQRIPTIYAIKGRINYHTHQFRLYFNSFVRGSVLDIISAVVFSLFNDVSLKFCDLGHFSHTA